MAEIQSILFASDLTPESDHAFEHARFLADLAILDIIQKTRPDLIGDGHAQPEGVRELVPRQRDPPGRAARGPCSVLVA